MSNNRGYDSKEYWLQLLSDDNKELNMSESYSTYCFNRDIPCLPTGDSLQELLATRVPPYNEHGERNLLAGYTTFIMKDPFEKTDHQLSPVGTLHLSSYWDYLLITYCTQKDPTRFFQQRLAGFLNEIADYYDFEGHQCLTRFMCFAVWAMKNGLKNIKSENWYDIPPMLRIIGTLHTTICKAQQSDITFYCQTALKGLPPRLVKLPLKKYGLKDFSGRNIDELTVSTILLFNNYDVMKSCASLLFSTIQFAQYRDYALHGIWITENPQVIKTLFLIIRLTLIDTFIEPLMLHKDLKETERAEITDQVKDTIQLYFVSYLGLIDEQDNGLRIKVPEPMWNTE